MTQIAQSPEESHLLDSARAGSSEAMRELWRQHHGAARRYAASLTRRFDPDDLVSEAFLRIFSAMQNGGGPTGALRPYLFVTIRNIAARWARLPGERSLDDIEEPGYDADLGASLVALANREKLQDALRSLPDQWQQVLWATEVHGERPAELAQRFGLRPNSVAALSYRAREALKQAWVQAHVGEDLGTGEHRWVRERIGRYVCHALTPRQRARFQNHVDDCSPCSAVLQDADHLAVLPIGVSALVLLTGITTPVFAQPSSASAAALTASTTSRPRVSVRGFARTARSGLATTLTATGIVAAGAIASVAAWNGLSTPEIAAPAEAQPAPSPTRQYAPAVPTAVTTPAPLEPAPPAEGDSPRSPVSSPVLSPPPPAQPDFSPSTPREEGRVPTTEQTASPSMSTVFTLSSIRAGGEGIAIVAIENDGEPLTQRTGGVAGSVAVFHAPAGVTFPPQEALFNDYEYSGAGRSASALAFTGCTSDADGSVLRCGVEAAGGNPADPREWVWRTGDTRRIYVRVAVADGIPSGSLHGSARLELTATGGTRSFDRPWSIDVPSPPPAGAPVVDTIDPTGDQITIAGEAAPGHGVTVRMASTVVGRATAGADGRWATTMPWGVTGDLTAEDD